MASTTIGSSGVTFPDATTQATAAVITKAFTSSNQAIPTATQQNFNVAHGLGTTPKIVRLVAVCLTAVNGWAVGDESEVLFGCVDNGALQVFCWADATNVGYNSGSAVLIMNRTTQFSYNIINNSNFALKIYAFA
jgi:hypothetical protein